MLKKHIPKALAAVSCPLLGIPAAPQPTLRDGADAGSPAPSILVDARAGGGRPDGIDGQAPANARSGRRNRGNGAEAPRG